MAKIVLDDASSGYQSTALYNSNNDAIRDHLDNKVLYRDNPTGEPNQMLNNLDMNSNRILNMGYASSGSEPVTLAQLEELIGVLTGVNIGGGDPGDPGGSLVFPSNGSTVVTITDTTHTITVGDTDRYLRFTSDLAITVDVPQNNGVEFDNTEIHFRQAGDGVIFFQAAIGQTINPPAFGTLQSGGKGSTMTLKKVGVDEWDLIGQTLEAE